MNPHQTTPGKPTSKFRLLFHDSRSLGVLLLFCTVLSLILSNLGSFGNRYILFWDTEIPGFHHLHLPHTFLHIINDALMTIFFFHVAMDIKREATTGELSSPGRMMLPAVSALFGVAFPAVIFLLVTRGTTYTNGWAIPTATDIAFSLGIISLLGKSVPYFMKVFLTALAIIDDLCAILIIAFFYGTSLRLTWLVAVVVIAVAVFFVNKHIRRKSGTPLMLVLGIAMWYCMYQSGIHSTLAGVLLAFLLPNDKLPKFEQLLKFPVNFLIVPLFALANTSIGITPHSIAGLSTSLSLGIILGLFIGKPLGITLAVFLLTKLNFVKLNQHIKWMQLVGVSILAGIGFTMSIFVSALAFPEDHSFLQDTAKLSVLVASGLAMIVGYVWLRAVARKEEQTTHLTQV